MHSRDKVPRVALINDIAELLRPFPGNAFRVLSSECQVPRQMGPHPSCEVPDTSGQVGSIAISQKRQRRTQVRGLARGCTDGHGAGTGTLASLFPKSGLFPGSREAPSGSPAGSGWSGRSWKGKELPAAVTRDGRADRAQAGVSSSKTTRHLMAVLNHAAGYETLLNLR